jgi:hypothetical protein
MNQYLIDRLKEASTWRGLVLIATSCGAIISPEQADSIVATGLLITGAIAAFFADNPGKKPEKENTP